MDINQRLALSRHAINRRSDLRQRADLWESLRTQPETRLFLISGSKFLALNESLHTVLFSEAERLGFPETQEFFFLGENINSHGDIPAGTAFIATAVTPEVASGMVGADASWLDIKAVGHQLSDLEAGLVIQAMGISQWHESYRYSPQTGEQSQPVQGGWVRQALGDEQLLDFPRTDPAVIVLVTDDQDRLLLGNNALWESNRYSLLAGFVEPGESLEAAVIREVFEESGLHVENPQYLASQPWPFPRSLMLGFHARVASGHSADAHQADGEEILHLHWFSKEELKASLGDIVLPGKTAIARVLIEHWLGEPLEYETTWGN